MSSGKQIAFEPAFAKMLAQHLHHAPVGRQMVIDRYGFLHRASVCHVKHRIQAIGVCLIRAEQSKIRRD